MALKFSGSPKKSEKHKNRLKKFKVVVYCWTLAILLDGIFRLTCIPIFKNEKLVSNGILDTILVVTITILINLLCEIIPILLVLNESFIKIFLSQEYQRASIRKVRRINSKYEKESNSDCLEKDIENSLIKNEELGQIQVKIN